MHLVLRTYLVIYTSCCVFAHLLHFSQNLFFEIVFSICKRIEIILELWVRDLIVGLISAIFWVIFLNGIVCEVDLRLKVMDIEEIWGSTYIAFLVPVSSSHSIDVGDKKVMPDIEFAVIIKKRSIDVHLHYKGLFFWGLYLSTWFFLSHWLLDNMIELINLIDNCYSFTLIRILPRLDNPYVPGLWSPSICWLLLYQSCSLLVKFSKAMILRIFKAFSDMEGQRYDSEHIFAYFFIVIFQIIKESLLVAKIKVILEMIVDQRLAFVVTVKLSFEETVSFKGREVFNDGYWFYFLPYFLNF